MAMIEALYHHLDRFRREQRGTALVEMALIAPLMLILSAGVFEFGNLIHKKLLMEAGLSDAARFAARCNSQLYTKAGLTINCADICHKHRGVRQCCGDRECAHRRLADRRM